MYICIVLYTFYIFWLWHHLAGLSLNFWKMHMSLKLYQITGFWIFKNCVWSINLTTKKIGLAIENGQTPNKVPTDWKSNKIKILYKNLIKNFQEASRLTNNLSSTEGESYCPKIITNKRKKGFKKKWYQSWKIYAFRWL